MRPIDQAIALHQRGNLADAESIYRSILSTDTRNFDALHMLGIIHAQRSEFEKAENLLRTALSIDQNACQCYYNYGNVLSKLSRHQSAIENYNRAIQLDPNIAPVYSDRGNAQRELGRFEEAILSYEKAVSLNPSFAAAYYNRGIALFELKRYAESLGSYERAIALAPNYAEAWSNRGNVFAKLRQFNDAFAAYDRALTLKPDLAEAWLGRGAVFAALMQFNEAAEHYQKALALQPGLIEAANNLASIWIAQGKAMQALAVIRQALSVQETDESKALFVECLEGLRIIEDPWNLRSMVLRALSELWSWPRQLAGVSIRLIKLTTIINECCARAMSAWPVRLPERELLGPFGLAAVTDDKLLVSLLESTMVCDVELERLLTGLRHTLLEAAERSSSSSDFVARKVLRLYCALATQCFINEYVFDVTEDELDRARQLRDRLIAAQPGGSVPILWLVAVAAYLPLHSLAAVDALLEKSWPDPVTRLLTLQVREPREELGYRDSIPCVTAIGDDVSLRVKQQYEENPYPRWMKVPRTKEFKEQFRLNSHEFGSAKDVLVAGCGTGLPVIEICRNYPGAQVLAIDLSLASLCFAKRKTHAEGLSNVEYAQADILNLASLGRTFDIVHATGVLHHLADPWEGWRALLSLLRPSGTMIVGLYSKLARRDITAARIFIAERGYLATVEDIRRARQDMIALADCAAIMNVAKSPDFFATSECRDLLFHVQEHQLTLPEIANFLADNNLEFRDFVDAQIVQKFKLRFPDDGALTDLGLWHIFETENPDTFLGMYQFQVRKKVAAD